jgi:hypothetical protein
LRPRPPAGCQQSIPSHKKAQEVAKQSQPIHFFFRVFSWLTPLDSSRPPS